MKRKKLYLVDYKDFIPKRGTYVFAFNKKDARKRLSEKLTEKFLKLIDWKSLKKQGSHE